MFPSCFAQASAILGSALNKQECGSLFYSTRDGCREWQTVSRKKKRGDFMPARIMRNHLLKDELCDSLVEAGAVPSATTSLKKGCV